MLTSVLQPTHLIILLGIALLILGPKRLPEAGRALGQGITEFKSSIDPTRGTDPEGPDQSFQPEQALPPRRDNR
jgi:sec-independent protein translocase protein TatA